MGSCRCALGKPPAQVARIFGTESHRRRRFPSLGSARRSRMTTPIVAGMGVAAVAMTGRAAILAFEAWKKAPPRMRKFYDGGFEPEMTRREAAMILGVRESAAFALFLSAGVLARPFCLLEIRTALEADKPVLLVHEDDARHGAFGFAEFDGAPPEVRALAARCESMPYRRRRHEADAFFRELVRRIERCCVQV